MGTTFLSLALINFFIKIAVYSTSDIITVLSKNLFKGDIRMALKLLYLSVFKLAVSFLSSYVAEKRHNHKGQLFVACLLFCASTAMFQILNLYTSSHSSIPLYYKFLVGAQTILYYSSMGIIFGTLDGLNINWLVRNSEISKFSIIKQFNTLGHMLALTPNLIFGKTSLTKKDFFKNIDEKAASTILGVIASLLSALFIYKSAPDYVYFKENKKKKQTQKFSLRTIFTPSIIVFNAIILLLGIQKSVFTTFYRIALDEIKHMGGKEAAYIQMFRLVFELLFYQGIKGFFKVYVNERVLFVTSTLLLSMRVGIFNVALKTDDITVYNILFYTSEVLKALFSSAYNISSPLVCHFVASDETKVLAQGIYNGIYTGGANIILSTFSLILFYGKDLKGSVYVECLKQIFMVCFLLSVLGFAICLPFSSYLNRLKNKRAN